MEANDCLASASSLHCASTGAPPHLDEVVQHTKQTGKLFSILCKELNWLIKKPVKPLNQQGNGWDHEERRERVGQLQFQVYVPISKTKYIPCKLSAQ